MNTPASSPSLPHPRASPPAPPSSQTCPEAPPSTTSTATTCPSHLSPRSLGQLHTGAWLPPLFPPAYVPCSSQKCSTVKMQIRSCPSSAQNPPWLSISLRGKPPTSCGIWPSSFYYHLLLSPWVTLLQPHPPPCAPETTQTFIPTSGPLHWLFPPPLLTAPSFPKSLLQCHLVSETFSDP